jgi:hypothetical protein
MVGILKTHRPQSLLHGGRFLASRGGADKQEGVLVSEKLRASASVELQAAVATSVELLRIAAVELLHAVHGLDESLHAELLDVMRNNDLLNHNTLARDSHLLHANTLHNDLLPELLTVASQGRHSRKGNQGEGEDEGFHFISPIKKG